MQQGIDTIAQGTNSALTLTVALAVVVVIIVIASVTAIINKTKKD